MRRLGFWAILVISFGVLIFRLSQLSFFEGERNRILADSQRIKTKKITAQRGIIYDRNLIPLVKNWPLYQLCLNSNRKCEIIDREKALVMQAEGKDAELGITIGRKYLYPREMAHVLGFLGEATEDEVSQKKYLNGDLVGRTGIEQAYDEILRGFDGGELVEIDTEGKVIRVIGQKEPIAGKDLHLNLDSRLQEAASQAIQGIKGAVVVQNPQNGEILALVSSPSFNPDEISQTDLDNPNQPFFNRAISGEYPPGSTFKMVSATAALESGAITADTLIKDEGIIHIGLYSYSNWYFTSRGKTEGSINVIRAIARSTDTFFYKMGEMTGAQKIIDWAKIFKLGSKLGIEIMGESDGYLPNPKNEQWFLGNTYHLAIGQGSLGLTPLQVNSTTGVIASGGKWCKPSLTKTVNNAEQNNCTRLKISEKTLSIIKEGMKEACAAGGTATQFIDFVPQIACKTGTAEFNDPKKRTHAWFTAFAPIDNPQISVTVLAEAGGEGSVVAAPVAKKVLDLYFNGN
jgi:penicillin-binding protein 2